MAFLQKTLSFVLIYVVSQIFLMGLLWFAFGMNLFETTKSDVSIEDLSLVQLKTMVALNQLFSLLLPAILYLILFYRKRLIEQIDFNIPLVVEVILIALGLLLFSFPIIHFLAELNQKIPLTAWMKSTAGEIDESLLRIIEMNGKRDLIINLILIALLPAFAEELFFRGVIQKELIAYFRKTHVAIITTAIVFSAFHMQFDGFLPRLFLGALLGYTYYFSRSFLIPVLIHFTNNAILVVSVYLKPEKLEDIELSSPIVNYPLLILSIIIVVYLMHLMKIKSKDG